MSSFIKSLGIAAAVLALASCVTTFDGVWVSGRANDVSAEDVRQAIAACERNDHVPRLKPRQIDVIDRDEIHIYWGELKAVYGGHSIAKRVRGKWTCEERVIIVS
jgi:hypothetical protein